MVIKNNTLILTLLFIGLSCPLMAYAEKDSLRKVSFNRLTPFVSFGVESLDTRNGTILQKTISAGVTINHKLNFALYSSWYNAVYEEDFNFKKFGLPEVKMRYMQGGVLTSYDHRISRLFSLNLGAKVGQGSARIIDRNNELTITKQRVVIMHPDIGLEVAPFDFVRVKLNVGYQLMTDAKMQELLQGEATGLSYGVNLRFDLFRRKFSFQRRSYSFTHRP